MWVLVCLPGWMTYSALYSIPVLRSPKAGCMLSTGLGAESVDWNTARPLPCLRHNSCV